MKNLITAVLMFLTIGISLGQGTNKRLSFAKSYYGLDINYVPNYGESQFLNESGNLEDFTRSGFVNPAINIGATHFWGFADFYVSITTGNISTSEEKVKTATNFGAFTGMRIYPLQLTNNKLRPYVGYKFSPFRYLQENIDGISSKTTKVQSVFDAGIGYRLPSFYMYLGYNYVMSNEVESYVSRTQKVETTLPRHFFNVGINFMLETTQGTNNPFNNKLNELLSADNLNGFFWGIGPSAAFSLNNSSYNRENHPFLDDKTMAMTFPDISLGYHFTKYDIVTSLAYRPIVQVREALDFKQRVGRNSLALEAYKVIGDYHGFAPYVGAGVGFEHLTLKEEDENVEITNLTETQITPVITFGWDIRPARKGDFWVLKTNLRYSPLLKLPVEGQELSLEQLEFNFIQFVFYPQRYQVFKNLIEKQKVL